MHQKKQNKLFCDVTKNENFDRKCLTLSKENQKSPLKHIRFGRSKFPVQGLTHMLMFEKNVKRKKKRNYQATGTIK
jgi:hypothetical protein